MVLVATEKLIYKGSRFSRFHPIIFCNPRQYNLLMGQKLGMLEPLYISFSTRLGVASSGF